MSTSPTPWSAGRPSACSPASGFAGRADATSVGPLRLVTTLLRGAVRPLRTLVARRLALQARAELSRLDDRVLADMGLERALLLAALGDVTHRLIRQPREC